jgi:opacity protein-like surface antigen
MKSFALLLAIAALLAVPAVAQVVYENGPINGNVDAWTINFGFAVADSFTISGGPTAVSGLSFGVWLNPGDTLQSVEVQLTSEQFGGTLFFQGQVPLTQSGCVLNSYSYDVCTETGSFTPTMFNNGMYWLELQNAVDTQGNPVFWDQNSGVGCHSPGCPSEAGENFESIPSEAFSLLGTSSASTSTSVPEPSSLMLFASGVLGLGGLLRRKLL